MDNFRHEIPCPDDRAIRKFLWSDYFHDASLDHIEHDRPAFGDLTIQAACVWEVDKLWPSVPGQTREEKRAYFDQHLAPRVTYRLRFHRVRHFEHAIDRTWLGAEELLSGRFKDTPLRRRLQKALGKPLYHLRFRTSCGYMDVIFERFSIRKVEGRVDYRWSGDDTLDFWRECMATDAQSTLKALKGTPEDSLDEYDRASLLTARLFACDEASDPEGIRTLARQIIAGNDARASFEEEYAVYLLGFHGEESDILPLMQLLHRPGTDPLAARNLCDAIERIMERRRDHA